MKQKIRIAHLNLINFRGFEDLSVDFDDKLTVFIGNNGSGKTTILEAVAGSLQYVKEQVQDNVQKEVFKDTDIRVATGVDTFDVNLSFSAPSANLQGAYIRRGRSSFNFRHVNDTNESDYEIEATLKTWYRDNKSLEIIAYYPCQAISMDNGQAVNFNVFNVENAYDELLDGRFNFSLLKKWLIWQYSLRQERTENKLFDYLVAAIIGEKGVLNDEQRTFTDLRVTYRSSPEGSLLFVKNSAALEEHQLSSGEKMLFALVADIARRLITANPHADNPLEEGSGVVLIDEIDLHLHPNWQRKVVGKLCAIFPNVQFVVTTHSAVVLSHIYSKHIRTVENGNVYGVSDTYGHDDADDMLRIMGVESESQQKIKAIHRLLRADKIDEAKAIRQTIVTEGAFTPLLEIDLFIKRKEKQAYEAH